MLANFCVVAGERTLLLTRGFERVEVLCRRISLTGSSDSCLLSVEQPVGQLLLL